MVSARDWLLGHFLRPVPPTYDTPVPGVLLTVPEIIALIERVAPRFLPPGKEYGRYRPIRCDLQGGLPCSPAAIDDLGAEVYIFLEFTTGAVYRSRAADVSDYFRKREPWESYDFYLFDLELTRCVCCTHDDAWILYEAIEAGMGG